MNDLLSPIFKVCEGDEGLAFWCFVGLLDMLKTNFQVRGKGIGMEILLFFFFFFFFFLIVLIIFFYRKMKQEFISN